MRLVLRLRELNRKMEGRFHELFPSRHLLIQCLLVGVPVNQSVAQGCDLLVIEITNFKVVGKFVTYFI